MYQFRLEIKMNSEIFLENGKLGDWDLIHHSMASP